MAFTLRHSSRSHKLVMSPAVIVVAIMISWFANTSETVASELDDLPVVSGVVEVDFAENGTGVVGSYTANGTVMWGLSGEDSAVFSIDSGTGVLSFVGSPDFEAPGDADSDNEYLVTVEASDGEGTGSLDVRVTVTDAPAVSGPGDRFCGEQHRCGRELHGGWDGFVGFVRTATISASGQRCFEFCWVP